MKFISHVGDIVILDDEKQYEIVKCLELDNHGYLVIKRLKINLASSLSLEIEEIQVVEEVIDSNKNYYFCLVTDKNILEQINKMLNIETK